MYTLQKLSILAMAINSSAFTAHQHFPSSTMPLSMAPAIDRLLAQKTDFTMPTAADFTWYTEGQELKGKMVYNEYVLQMK